MCVTVFAFFTYLLGLDTQAEVRLPRDMNQNPVN